RTVFLDSGVAACPHGYASFYGAHRPHGGENETIEHLQREDDGEQEQLALADFPVFQETLLADVEKIEFPFMPDDPEEFYVLKLKDRELYVNQLTGEVVEETRYPYSLLLEKLSFDLHTGRTNAIWAII